MHNGPYDSLKFIPYIHNFVLKLQKSCATIAPTLISTMFICTCATSKGCRVLVVIGIEGNHRFCFRSRSNISPLHLTTSNFASNNDTTQLVYIHHTPWAICISSTFQTHGRVPQFQVTLPIWFFLKWRQNHIPWQSYNNAKFHPYKACYVFACQILLVPLIESLI